MRTLRHVRNSSGTCRCTSGAATTNLWMLQNFKSHCSLRFSPPFFATQRQTVDAAGYESGEGFIKLPYKRELPVELLKALMQARVEHYETTGAE